MTDTLNFDGSCDPNPGGRLGFGWVLTLDKVPTTGQGAEPPHPSNTNNIGEYRGLIAGLRAYLATGRPGPLQVIGDSQLILHQVQGIWRAKQPLLAQRCQEARQVAAQIPNGVTYTWRGRAENTAADALASDGTSSLPAPSARTYTARGAVPVAPALAAQIARLNADPAPGFKAFVQLAVGGTDGLSAKKLPDLVAEAGPDAAHAVAAAFPNEPTRQAAVLRWYLRGLAIELAIRKGQADAELAQRSRR